MDWSPQLWIACFDDDEQNARLASRAWEDNGLDIPENFLDTFVTFLGESSQTQLFLFFSNWVRTPQ